jgi:hypothetical protein
MKQNKKAGSRAMGRRQEMIHIPLRAADAKRSVKNILQWNCYLPPDCVRTMVRMGWDYTT